MSGTAHPRVSGENLDRNPELQGCFGSSPRERGKLWVFAVFVDAQRLIPA